MYSPLVYNDTVNMMWQFNVLHPLSCQYGAIPEGAIITEDWQTTTLKDALWTKRAEKDLSKAAPSTIKTN